MAWSGAERGGLVVRPRAQRGSAVRALYAARPHARAARRVTAACTGLLRNRRGTIVPVAMGNGARRGGKNRCCRART